MDGHRAHPRADAEGLRPLLIEVRRLLGACGIASRTGSHRRGGSRTSSPSRARRAADASARRASGQLVRPDARSEGGTALPGCPSSCRNAGRWPSVRSSREDDPRRGACPAGIRLVKPWLPLDCRSVRDTHRVRAQRSHEGSVPAGREPAPAQRGQRARFGAPGTGCRGPRWAGPLPVPAVLALPEGERASADPVRDRQRRNDDNTDQKDAHPRYLLHMDRSEEASGRCGDDSAAISPNEA